MPEISKKMSETEQQEIERWILLRATQINFEYLKDQLVEHNWMSIQNEMVVFQNARSGVVSVVDRDKLVMKMGVWRTSSTEQYPQLLVSRPSQGQVQAQADFVLLKAEFNQYDLKQSLIPLLSRQTNQGTRIVNPRFPVTPSLEPDLNRQLYEAYLPVMIREAA